MLGFNPLATRPLAGRARTMSCLPGAYTYTGVAATLIPTHNQRLSVSNGVYTYTGQSAGLFKGYTLSANNGVYASTGQNAILTPVHHYAISASSGVYVYTGKNSTLAYLDRGWYIIPTT